MDNSAGAGIVTCCANEESIIGITTRFARKSRINHKAWIEGMKTEEQGRATVFWCCFCGPKGSDGMGQRSRPNMRREILAQFSPPCLARIDHIRRKKRKNNSMARNEMRFFDEAVSVLCFSFLQLEARNPPPRAQHTHTHTCACARA